MKEFTEKEYFRTLELFPGIISTLRFAEKGEEYSFDEDGIEIHNEHDKLYKSILSRPKEMLYAIKKATNIKEDLDIIPVRNELVTVDFRGRQADIIYKLRDKEVYFLLEHQSTQDSEMPYRVLEYETQIMHNSFSMHNFKQKFKARVISILLFTGIGGWNGARSIVEIQEQFGYIMKPTADYEGIGEYNVLDIEECTEEELLDIEECTEEELLADDTLLSKAMLLEKARYEDELIDTLEKIIPMIKDDERGLMIAAIRYILIKDLGKKQARKFIKELEGGIDMGIFVNELRMNKELERIKSEGRRDGERNGILKTAKNMLKEKIDINIIEKVTGLKRNQFM